MLALTAVVVWLVVAGATTAIVGSMDSFSNDETFCVFIGIFWPIALPFIIGFSAFSWFQGLIGKE